MITISEAKVSEAVQHEVRPDVVADNIRAAFRRVNSGDILGFKMGRRNGEWFVNGEPAPWAFLVYEHIDKGRLVEISRSDDGWLADKRWKIV